jgi:hypothetical protein
MEQDVNVLLIISFQVFPYCFTHSNDYVRSNKEILIVFEEIMSGVDYLDLSEEQSNEPDQWYEDALMIDYNVDSKMNYGSCEPYEVKRVAKYIQLDIKRWVKQFYFLSNYVRMVIDPPFCKDSDEGKIS